MNKRFELSYRIKKKHEYFGLKHLELWKPHGEAKKKTLWTVVGIELMATVADPTERDDLMGTGQGMPLW